MNLFFHYLHTRVFSDYKETKVSWSDTYTYKSWTAPDWITKVKINPSQKHLDIQAKRKEWLKLREQADIALKAYKEEKGDYYKS